jgi:hypothetical protein
MAEWVAKRILITVRTYPIPARKGIEVSSRAASRTMGNGYGSSPCPIVSLRKIRLIRYPLHSNKKWLPKPNATKPVSDVLIHWKITVPVARLQPACLNINGLGARRRAKSARESPILGQCDNAETHERDNAL